MTRIFVTRTINAPIDVVFNTVADIRQFSQALPHVVRFEFLTGVGPAIGTRFRETRLMNGKETDTELEITEYVENDYVRLLADSHGTVWDTVFSVREEGGNVALAMTMDAKAYRPFPRLMNLLINGMIQKAVERDMDLVKEYCENRQ